MSLLWPTPLTVPSWSSDDGSSVAIARSVLSWKMTYGGMAWALAIDARHARKRSNSGSAEAGKSAASTAGALAGPEEREDEARRWTVSRRIIRVTSPRRTEPLRSVRTSVPYSPSTAR